MLAWRGSFLSFSHPHPSAEDQSGPLVSLSFWLTFHAILRETGSERATGVSGDSVERWTQVVAGLKAQQDSQSQSIAHSVHAAHALSAQTRQLVQLMRHEVLAAKSLLKSRRQIKEGKQLDARLTRLSDSLTLLDASVTPAAAVQPLGTERSQLLARLVPSSEAGEQSPRSLFVRTLVSVAGSAPSSAAAGVAGSNGAFQEAKGSLEREMQQLRQQLGLLCHSLQSPLIQPAS